MNKKVLKIALAIVFGLLLIYCIWHVIKTNLKENVEYQIESPFITTIEQKSMATGKIIPKEKVDIKPNISGIIKEIRVKEGEKVKTGDLIALIQVVPVVSNVNTAMQAIASAKIQLENKERLFKREAKLYEQGVVSREEYENYETDYKAAKQTLDQAQKDYDIAKTGLTPGLENLASIQIRSTANGIILDVPVEIGDQVIETNTFNAGTTIATVADTNKMIFEGEIDEEEAGSITEGTPMKIIIGALKDQSIEGILTFVAPQGKEENGSIKYKIKADLSIPNEVKIRAGYSANGEVILKKRENVLAIKEALVQYDEDKPFIEVQQADGSFKKEYVSLGISDGLNVEVMNINKYAKIKVWNPISEK